MHDVDIISVGYKIGLIALRIIDQAPCPFFLLNFCRISLCSFGHNTRFS